MLEKFTVAKYEVTIETGERGLSLPPYKGSTLRGGFGSAFKRISCSLREGECRACLLRTSCPYAYIFETSPPPGSEALRNFESVPRPFVLEPPMESKTEYAPGEKLAFNLILVGKAINYLPYFIVAFRELGEMGIGRMRKKYRLNEIRAVHPVSGENEIVYHAGDQLVRNVDLALRCDIRYDPVPSCPENKSTYLGNSPHGDSLHSLPSADSLPIKNNGCQYFTTSAGYLVNCSREVIQTYDAGLQGKPDELLMPCSAARAPGNKGRAPEVRRLGLEYRTMTRIKFEENYVNRIEFHMLMRSLLRRLSSLAYFHHGWELGLDFTGLIERAAKVRLVEDNTRWVDWERYSSRQDNKMNLGGVVGRVVYEGDVDEFIPLLRLGELVHVGKGAVFGMGKYSILGG